MNTKKWLTLGLSVALAGCLGWAVAACAPTEPNPNEGDKPGINNPDDPNTPDNPDNPGEGDVTPDADLDTREFWVTGAGAGDLQNASWTELKSNFKLTKESKKDAEGFTLYTIQFKIYAGGDSFKIRQNEKDENGALKWTDGTYFGIDEVRNASGTFIDAGTKNIGVATGKDGIYKFTVHTKPSPAPWKDNYVSWELVESVTPPTTTEDMYIVGKLAAYPKNDWPDYGVIENCIHMTFDGDKTWSATITVKEGDQFKVYNKLNKQYYPDQGGNLGRPSDAPDGLFEVTWVSGALKPTLKHVHTYSKWAYDSENHWKACDFDNAKDESSVEAHDFTSGDTCECGFQQEADPDWKINGDGTLNEYTGDYTNLKIPADLTVFPDFGKLFGMGKNNTYEFAKCEPKNVAKVQSVTVDPKNEHFKVENNAVLSKDGTILYMYLPYSTETEVAFEDVTAINNSAFYYNTTVTSVSFPKAVTVGKYAFSNASKLQTISFPKAETLSAYCFSATKITNAEFESVKTIKSHPFYQCPLVSVVFGEQLADVSDDEIFATMDTLTSITIKATTPPTASSWGIVFGCKNAKIYVPAESVETYKTAQYWSSLADKIEAIPTEAVAPSEVAMLPDSKH